MIDIKFTLQENDFLQLNLYYFKSDGRLRRLTLKTWIAYSIIIVILSGFLVWKEENTMAVTLLIIMAILSIFYKKQMKNTLLKQFKKTIINYESRFDKEVELKVNDSEMQIKSIAGSTNFNLNQIVSISETHDYFFIKFKIEALVIPKLNNDESKKMGDDFKKLAENLNIKFHNDLNWKW